MQDYCILLSRGGRLKTHTFNLLKGELIITLQDVQIIMGLLVHGQCATDDYRLCDEDMVELFPRLLGVSSSHTLGEITKTYVQLSWLKTLFQRKPTNQIVLSFLYIRLCKCVTPNIKSITR